MSSLPSLQFEALGPIWLEILMFGITGAALVYAILATRHQPLNLRIIIGSLRFLLLSIGLMLLHHPTITRQIVVPKEQRMAVMIDRTGSMGAESGNGQTRYEKAYDMIGALPEDGRAYDIFEFDQNLSEPLGGFPGPRKLSGNKTDFYSSLTQLLSESGDYTGILLLSDGHDLGKFTQMSTGETSTWLTRLSAPPINTVLVGDQMAGPEIAIHSIDAPAFSYVRAPVRIRATILVRNLDNHLTQVQLLDNENVIQIKDLALDDQGFGTVEFEHYPEVEGDNLYTIMVPPHPLETNIENNKQQVLMEIGRDKINVLHISGSITWDLQGIRSMFERNPLVDLTAFYIMRTREHFQQGVDGRLVPPDEMALVPFPTEEIFDRQLFGFDVVVFQDFDAGTYFTDSYQARRLMKKIRDFVSDHRGGFLVIGGPRSAAGPSLGLTPLAEIIPLVPPVHRIGYDESNRKPVLTEKGEKHPILRQFDPEKQSFAGSMQSLTVNKKAKVLLEDDEGTPLIAVSEPGNGRTLFLNTSSSWKWRRDAIADGRPASGYYSFWDQTLKWMIQDPSLNQVQVSTTKTVSNPLAVDVDILLRDQNYEPAENAEVTIQLTPLDKKAAPLQTTVHTDRNGTGQAKFATDRPGYYRIEVVEEPWASFYRPATIFLGGSQEELRNLDLAPETLQRLASLSGGKFLSGNGQLSARSFVWGKPQSKTIVETKRLKLRNWIWSLPILILIGGIEWAFRRSSHLA